MIEKLEGREKVQVHIVANRVNEIIEILNELELKTGEKEEEEKDE